MPRNRISGSGIQGKLYVFSPKPGSKLTESRTSGPAPLVTSFPGGRLLQHHALLLLAKHSWWNKEQDP